jgi:hypothetical protein
MPRLLTIWSFIAALSLIAGAADASTFRLEISGIAGASIPTLPRLIEVRLPNETITAILDTGPAIGAGLTLRGIYGNPRLSAEACVLQAMSTGTVKFSVSGGDEGRIVSQANSTIMMVGLSYDKEHPLFAPWNLSFSTGLGLISRSGSFFESLQVAESLDGPSFWLGTGYRRWLGLDRFFLRIDVRSLLYPLQTTPRSKQTYHNDLLIFVRMDRSFL